MQHQKNQHDESEQFLNLDDVERYLRALFGCVNFGENDYVCFRGIGEKGTNQEGEFREEKFVQPALVDFVEVGKETAARYAKHYIASFIVPAVLNSPKASSQNVKLLTSILTDLDSGDTIEKLSYLRKHIGDPSMVVQSGGFTENETPKLHVYWIFHHACDDIHKVVAMRDALAKKVGGDPQFGLGKENNPFGRAHQPIRIAGSVHGKDKKFKTCKILEEKETRYHVTDLEDSINRMPQAPFAENPKAEKVDSMGPIFSPHSERSFLTEKVHEGGVDVTRFSEFSRVAGHYIHTIRQGLHTIEEAYQNTLGWVAVSMTPPWPENRCRTEFQAILNKDISEHGPFPQKVAPIFNATPEEGILAWAACNWVKGPKPEHTELVEGFIIKGEPHLIVAEGGAGKTGAVLDLARKIAAWLEGDDLYWNGAKIKGGGTVVLILNEDSKTEIHRRLVEIDGKDGMIQKAGRKLIVMPMASICGPFPLASGEKSTQRWEELMGELRKIPDLAAVIFDTFNSISHGDENSSTVVAEIMREARRVCGELGAALIINHHIRKSDEAIRSLQELLTAIRGSTSIPNNFRVNLGYYECPDYERRMKSMGLKPERKMLWRFGVAKANINIVSRAEKTLLRNEIGLLEDVTDKDQFSNVNVSEREKWLVHAIKTAAEEGHPYKRGERGASSLYSRRSELPPPLKKIGVFEFKSLVENLLQEGRLALCSIGNSKEKSYLDIPGGSLATDSVVFGKGGAGAYIHPDWKDFDCIDRGIIDKRKKEEEEEEKNKINELGLVDAPPF